MMVKFVNDSDRVIYAFEMLPPPQIDDIISAVTTATGCSDVATSSERPNNIFSAMSTVTTADTIATACSSTATCDVINDLFDGFVVKNVEQGGSETAACCGTLEGESCTPTPFSGCRGNNNDESILNNSCEASTSTWDPKLELNPDVDWQHNYLENRDADEFEGADIDGTGIWKSTSLQCAGSVWGGDDAGSSSLPTVDVDRIPGFLPMNSDGSFVDAFSDDVRADDVGGGLRRDSIAKDRLSDVGDNDGSTCNNEIAADQWKTCAICLEEMLDSDLLKHVACGGTLCNNCLEVQISFTNDFFL